MSEAATAGGTTVWRDYIAAEGQIVTLRTTSPAIGTAMNWGTPNNWGSGFNWHGLQISVLYFTTDHLGSTSVLTNPGAVVQERDSYDAWGKRRNSNGTDNTACSITSLTTRGFTGQEMMDSVCEINLNARIYDPTIARMMTADPTIPNPVNGQSYNRYSYVNNRPLSLMDVTGYIPDWGSVTAHVSLSGNYYDEPSGTWGTSPGGGGPIGFGPSAIYGGEIFTVGGGIAGVAGGGGGPFGGGAAGVGSEEALVGASSANLNNYGAASVQNASASFGQGTSGAIAGAALMVGTFENTTPDPNFNASTETLTIYAQSGYLTPVSYVPPFTLGYATVGGGITNGMDGSKQWLRNWILSHDSRKGGWVIQKITMSGTGAYAALNTVYWEAWSVAPGTYGPNLAGMNFGGIIIYSADDNFQTPMQPSNYRGTITITGSAAFYEGYTLPSTFTPGGASEANGLMSTYERPNLPPASTPSVPASLTSAYGPGR